MRYRFQPSLLAGIVNGLVFSFYVALIKIFLDQAAIGSWQSDQIVPVLFLSFPLLAHGWLFFTLLQSFFKQQSPKVKMRYYWLLSAVPSLLLGWFFFCYFLASDWSGLLISVVILGFSWWVAKHFSRPVWFSFLVVGVLFVGGALSWGFEEDYCLDKANQADPSGQILVEPTAKEWAVIREISPTSNTRVSKQFVTHFMCHDSFNIWTALKESYLP